MIESVQGLVWLTLQMLVLYAVDTQKSREKTLAELRYIGTFFVLLTSLSSLTSLLMFAKRFGKLVVLSKNEVVMRGFILGRLWGVFTDPNYASVTVIISGLFSLYFIKKANSILIKILNVVALLASFLYLVFSDSRTGYVTMFAAVAVFFFFSLSQKKAKKKEMKNLIVLHIVPSLLALSLAVSSLAFTVATKKAYNYAVTTHSSTGGTSSGKPGPNFEIKRESEEESTDISNRRLSIWNSGKEIFLKAPVFGVGFRNIVAAAKDKAPETYIINNDFTDFNAFHNMWIDILVSQGLVGLLTFLLFALACAHSLFKTYKRLLKKELEGIGEFALLSSIATACLVSSLFLSDTVFVNTQNSVIFWTALGFLMNMSLHKDTPVTDSFE